MARVLWLDRLRGAAILAVVLLHAEQTTSRVVPGHLVGVHEINVALEPIRMPLLVFLSGLLLSKALAKAPERYLRGKVESLLWPYLVWSAIDIGIRQLRSYAVGDEVTWGWLLRVFYAPPTYLWFLAYLFCFYVISLVLPRQARAAAAPLLLAAGLLTDGQAAHFLGLFGWFLIGDIVGQRVQDRLRPTPTKASGGALARLGQNSLVFYACHVVVMGLVADQLIVQGMTEIWLVFGCLVVSGLVGGAALVVGRRNLPTVAALFEPPRQVRFRPWIAGDFRGDGSPWRASSQLQSS